ncbi:hypothetical protein FB451DRAFT_1193846 [Mycena latifolia]|nr:hypothetical protein FB451DRAFT_1193846 [Mycena latifolia]
MTTHILYVTSTCGKLDQPNNEASEWTGAWVTTVQKQCSSWRSAGLSNPGSSSNYYPSTLLHLSHSLGMGKHYKPTELPLTLSTAAVNTPSTQSKRDRVACHVTHTVRPQTLILRDPAQFTESTVVKCGGSCQCLHKHFYNCAPSVRQKAKTFEQHNLVILHGRETDPTDLNARHGMLWLVQDLVLELCLYGEYCTFYARFASVVSTRGRDQVQGYPEPQDVLIRCGGSADQRHEAMQTLHNFVLRMLHSLIASAECMWDAPSLLRDFACVDISFMEKGDIQPGYNYFVNEVKLCSNGVCLFLGYSESSEMVMDELLTAILSGHTSWVEARRPVVQAKPRAKTSSSRGGTSPRSVPSTQKGEKTTYLRILWQSWPRPKDLSVQRLIAH